MKYTWVFYDVSDHKGRRKLARLCLQNGLHRVQRSVFMGKVRKFPIKAFHEETIKLVNAHTDQVIVLQTSRKSVSKMLTIGSLPGITTPGEIIFL